jgi:hypothetical protein
LKLLYFSVQSWFGALGRHPASHAPPRDFRRH